MSPTVFSLETSPPPWGIHLKRSWVLPCHSSMAYPNHCASKLYYKKDKTTKPGLCLATRCKVNSPHCLNCFWVAASAPVLICTMLLLYGITGLVASSPIAFSGILGPFGRVVSCDPDLVPGMTPGKMALSAFSPALRTAVPACFMSSRRLIELRIFWMAAAEKIAGSEKINEQTVNS